ncbi:hypothetical protein COZ41_02470 [Candidatus Shapirobacteria bacterium CG_4_10_14_3_um_filter_35_13]|uniref:N-acetyltransferase domain-containing protein n=1 Tax=Candidatus Shapirobacteria bacterium CG_4_10_14_3_um_filter_35_13 TaxID=1974873 RepID=A0A2M7LIJ9_9BACT|nr:MAG: hypothetical protein COZ41_02470 [Candidatus Shapirobacteria bacterium CG_4_10_14_3_um_filter_35_13]
MSPETQDVIRLTGESYEYKQADKVAHDRVTLTSYNLKDAPEIFALIDRNRDFFTQYDHRWTDKPKYQTVEQFTDTIKNPEDQNIHYFFIRNAKEEAVGGCRLKVDEDDPKSAEIGYFIDQAQTHKRYASRAVRLIITYATEELKLQKIKAFVNHENIGSVTTLERNGFEFTGIDPEDPTYHWYEHTLPNPK